MKADQAKNHQHHFDFEIVLGPETGKKRMVLKAPRYFSHFLNNKTKVGDKGTVIVNFDKLTRSESQLRYYAVLVGLMAEEIGQTWEETHNDLMIEKWGTVKRKRHEAFGGGWVEERRSVANDAKFPKTDMEEQIDSALSKCAFLNINVPSKQELGYIPSDLPYSAKI